jgi:hypothetical protein
MPLIKGKSYKTLQYSKETIEIMGVNVNLTLFNKINK